MQLPFRAPEVQAVIERYEEELKKWVIPKLLVHAEPGLAITKNEVAIAKSTLPNLKVVSVGEGIHFIRETQPTAIGQAIAAWYLELGAGSPSSATLPASAPASGADRENGDRKVH